MYAKLLAFLEIFSSNGMLTRTDRRYFLEEDAVKDGKLLRDKDKAVNKIGHGMPLA
jgi:hypothetical protein